MGYSSLLSGGDDIADRYFGPGSEAGRVDPRMPKPVRGSDFAVGFGAGQFFEGDGGDIRGLGDALERSLLVDPKPKTPMDLIQADFPSTPSSVYSNRLVKPKQQETSRFVTTQDEQPAMSPTGQRLHSQSPSVPKSISSSSDIREETPTSSPRKTADFGPPDGTLDQVAAGMVNLQVSSYPGQPSAHMHTSRAEPQYMNQQMMQQQMMQQQMRGQGNMGGYMGSYGYQGMGIQPQYGQPQPAYMTQPEPVLGSHPGQFYMQQQQQGGAGAMYGNQMYYGGSNTGMNNGSVGQIPYQQQPRGPYGEQMGYGGMYGDPHQQMQQQWDPSGMSMEDPTGRMGHRPANSMPYQQQMQMMPPPSGPMYGNGSVMMPPMPGGGQAMPAQSQMWGSGSGGQSISAPIQQQQMHHPQQSSGGPMLYSQTLIQGIGSGGDIGGGTIVSPQRVVRMDGTPKDGRRPLGGPVAAAPTTGPGRGINPRLPPGKAPSATSSVGAVTGTPRDPLVEEFRNTFGKSKQWEIKDLVGHIVSFCQDQHGSRFIQQRLEVAPDAEKQFVFDELVPCAQSLMTDVFGNYVIQKLFEFGSPDQCEMLASMLMGQAVTLALQMYGCRVIQKALEYVNTERLIALVAEFEGQQVLRCVHDQNGNHVIQKCIEVVCRVARDSASPKSEFMSSKIQFIISAFNGRVRELSMHPYGCRVVQRILEHCPNSQKAPVLEELRKCCNELVQDQYGNYVIQHVMQHGWETDKAMLIREVQAHLLDYSQHKFASNVVEKCLQFANRKDRDEMIWTIINVTFDMNSPVDVNTGQCVLESMVRDPYANYVVQKVIDVSDERQRGAIVRYVKENIVQLRRYTYGKHIIVRLEKVCNEKF